MKSVMRVVLVFDMTATTCGIRSERFTFEVNMESSFRHTRAPSSVDRSRRDYRSRIKASRFPILVPVEERLLLLLDHSLNASRKALAVCIRNPHRKS